MRRVRIGLAMLVLLAAAAIALMWPKTGSAPTSAPAPAPPRSAPPLAAFDAPPGATPCESAYNAFRVVDQRARENAMPLPWTQLADRDTFIRRCQALPPEEQQCLVPRWAAEHHPACDPIVRRFESRREFFEP